jgi:hypothetical protein
MPFNGMQDGCRMGCIYVRYGQAGKRGRLGLWSAIKKWNKKGERRQKTPFPSFIIYMFILKNKK